jgi:hypothetical protein
MVGLDNVDNTSDASKPVSSATQTALNLKANNASPTFSGNVGIGTDNKKFNFTIYDTNSPSLCITSRYDGQAASMIFGTPLDIVNYPNTSSFKTAIIAQGIGYSRSKLLFCLNDSATQFDTNVTTTDARMTILPDGKVGIGITTPTSTLDVRGKVFISEDVSLNGNVTIDKDITIKGRLNVQQYTNQNIINTTTSNYQLIVSEDLSLNGRLFVSGNTTFGGTVSGITKTMVGLANVDNTSDANKPVSSATQTALDLKANNTSPTFTGTTTIVSANISSINLNGPLTLADNSVLMTSSLPLDFTNNFATTILPTSIYSASGARHLSISSTGQYQTVCEIWNGYIYNSNDYGKNWTKITSIGSKNHKGIEMSMDGQYRILCADNDYVYVSNDYGVSWTSKLTDSTRAWRGVTVSSNGKFQYVVDSSYMWFSNDYGSTFQSLKNDTVYYWSGIKCSADGRYVTGMTNNANRYIYVSSDYGSNFDVKSSILPLDNYSLTISANGKYQIIVKGGNDQYSKLISSSDYGVTWTEDTNAGMKHWQNISISSDGKHRVAAVYNSTIWISKDYGSTWSQSSFPTNLNWVACGITPNGQYIIASNYTSLYISVTPFDRLITSGSLIALSDATFNGNVTIGGRLYIGANSIYANSIMGGTLSTTTDLSLNTRLFVGADTSLNANLYVKGNVKFDGTVNFSANTITTDSIQMGVNNYFGMFQYQYSGKTL